MNLNHFHESSKYPVAVNTSKKELRYFNFDPSFELRWCRAQYLFGLEIPVTRGGFELRISCIRNSYLWFR